MTDYDLSIRHLLQLFRYDHLPSGLQDVSRPFCELACKTAKESAGPEATVALRKLLEAKDAAVRASKFGHGFEKLA